MYPSGVKPPGGELEFADDELSLMKAVVAATTTRRGALATVPVDGVPQSGTGAAQGNGARQEAMRQTARQPVFSQLDLLVDAAFARDGGGAAAQPAVKPDGGGSGSSAPAAPAVEGHATVPSMPSARAAAGEAQAVVDTRSATPVSEASPAEAGRSKATAPAPPAVDPSRMKTAPSLPAVTVPSPGASERAKTAPSIAPVAPPTPAAADPRQRTVPSMPVAASAASVPGDARAKTAPSLPAVSGARPGASGPSSLGPRAPAGQPTGSRMAEGTGVERSPREDAVFASSPPPDAALLRFTVPEPQVFRFIVAPVTPAFDAPANGAAAAVAATSAAFSSARRDDAEEIEPAQIEEAGDRGAGSPHGPPGSRQQPPVRPPAGAAVTAAPAPARASAPPPPATTAESGAEPDARGRRRRRSKPWFEELFDEDWLRTLPPTTPEQIDHEVAFLVDALKLGPRSTVLDIGCGIGRQAVGLARLGHEVTGLDLSLSMLMRAADVARDADASVNFVHGDMREMSFEGQFDAAYCWFTTFGYFDDDSNRAVAAHAYTSLKPGGRLLIDVVNRDFLLREVPARLWWQAEGCMVLEELDFNFFTSRLQNRRSVVFEDARQLEHDVSIRAYSLHEIGKLLHGSGFRVTEVSGSPHTRGRFFGAESRRIMIVAEKK